MIRMDEILTEERKKSLIEKFMAVAEEDVLTNMDAMMIIEILLKACERAQADVYEKMVLEQIKGDEPNADV